MEKGMAGDRPAQQVAAAPMQSVAPPDSGEKSIADIGEPQRKKKPSGGGGKPSGSITHPREGEFAKATLSKDADGTYRVKNDESGDTWRWDPQSEIWRGEDGTVDMPHGEPGPEDQAYSFSGEPNKPSDA